MQSGKLCLLPVTGPSTFLQGQGDESESFWAGFLLAWSLMVLNALVEVPQMLFMLLIAKADGSCFYSTFSISCEGNYQKLRRKVLRSLANVWEKLCPYPGHEGMTFKNALETDYKRDFKSAQDFLSFAWKRDQKGDLPFSRSVELWRTAEEVKKVLFICSRNPQDSQLVLESVVYPMNAQAVGDPVYLMNGIHGQGGNHYNGLLYAGERSGKDFPEVVGVCEESVDSTESLCFSEAAWKSKEFMAKGDALSTILRLDAMHIAEKSLGGKENLMYLSRKVICQVAAQQDVPSDEESKLKAAAVLAESLSEPADVANLISVNAALIEELQRILATITEPLSTTLPSAGGVQKEEEDEKVDRNNLAAAILASLQDARDKEAKEITEAVNSIKTLEEGADKAEAHKIVALVSVREALDGVAASEVELEVTR
jgi:hypothetical protein